MHFGLKLSLGLFPRQSLLDVLMLLLYRDVGNSSQSNKQFILVNLPRRWKQGRD